MRTLTTFLATLALALAACGGSDSSPTNDGGTTATKNSDTAPATATGTRSVATQGKCSTGATTTATCAAVTSYQACQITKCLPELKKAMGDGFMSGDNTGGSCGAWMTCTMACPCDNTANTCETGCNALMSEGTCMTDLQAMTGCFTTNCGVQPTCDGTTTTEPGANCTAAVKCCDTITATPIGAAYKTACAGLAAAGEEACAQALESMKAMCP